MARKARQKKPARTRAPEAAAKEVDLHPIKGMRLGARLRTYFLAGVLITAPVGITFYLVWLVVRFIDSRVTPLIPAPYNPDTYLPFTVPGLGVIVAFLVLTFVGWLTAGLVGRIFVRYSERLLARMPVVRGLYSAVKQIIQTILAQSSEAFRQVVLFEYPRRGSWALGFITGTTLGEVQNLTEDDVVNVFLPTTPNPTSGYLLFIPKNALVFLSMTVEEGIKMVVSGGIVTPPDRRAETEQQKPQVAAAAGDRRTIPHDRGD